MELTFEWVELDLRYNRTNKYIKHQQVAGEAKVRSERDQMVVLFWTW